MALLSNRRPIAAPALAALLWIGGHASAAADLRLCNGTASRVGVSIGYKDGDGWTTEGWWNIGPRACEVILRGPLVARYYYLYAVDYDQGGEWSGRAYMCTRDREFTIRGIEQCLTRGYDRIGFFEVDTKDQRTWTVQLTDDGQPQGGPPPMAAPLPQGPPGRRPAGGPPEVREAAPARPSGLRSTPLPNAPIAPGGPGGAVQGGVPAFAPTR